MQTNVKLGVFYEHIYEASQQLNIPLIDILKAVKDMGIKGVECELWRIEENPTAFKKQLEEAGLEVSGIYAFFNFDKNYSKQKIEQLIMLTEQVGAKRVLVIPGFIKIAQESQRKILLQKMVEALRVVCKLAEEKKIVVTLEDFDDQYAPFSTDDELIWFITQVPSLKCTFDTGNFMYRGINELMAFEKLKDHIVHVHCKDRSLISGSSTVPSLAITGKIMYPVAVGEGIIQMQEILTRLLQREYRGYFIIEHFGVANQLKSMRQSAKWLHAFLKKEDVECI